MKKLDMALIVCLAFSGAANANSALVCASKPEQTNKNGNVANLSNQTRFTCTDQLSGTIPELAEAGWAIVQVMMQEDTEHDRGVYQELLIQKP
jgi:hypothetical protein